MKIQYLKRKQLVTVTIDKHVLGFFVKPFENEQAGFVMETYKLFKEIDLKAVYGVPPVEGLDSAQVRDDYLYYAGQLIPASIALNMQAKTSPIPNVRVDIDTLGGIFVYKVIVEDTTWLIIPDQQAKLEDITLPADVKVVVGPAHILAGIPNILDAKVVVILGDAAEFSAKTGVEDISSKDSIAITASKLAEEAPTTVVAL